MPDEPFSKREVSRAGAHLAARLLEVRAGARVSVVDETDEADVHAREVVTWWRDDHVAPMLSVYDVVRDAAPKLDLGGSSTLAVSFRPKRFATIVDKLVREPGKLADMADLGGVRAVVGTQREADDLVADLGEQLDVRRVRDRVRRPAPTGYRGVHLHVRQDGRIIEVQVRTVGQDAWANVVEEESRLSGLNYKAGEGHEPVLRFLSLLADGYAVAELGEEHSGLPERIRAAFVEARPLLASPILRALKP